MAIIFGGYEMINNIIKQQGNKSKNRIIFLRLLLNSSNKLKPLRFRNGLSFQVIDKSYLEMLENKTNYFNNLNTQEENANGQGFSISFNLPYYNKHRRVLKDE